MVVMTSRSVYFTGSDGYHVGILGYVKGLYENGKLNEVTYLPTMKDITTAQRYIASGSLCFTWTDML